INLKFLRALPSSWSQVALTLKTKGGLVLLSFDDLYYKLKTIDVDVKGYTTFPSTQSAVPSHYAFVRATSASKKMSYGDSPSYSSTTTYSAPSNSKTGSHRSDFEQIEKLDLEEIDLKWKMVMLSIRVQKFEQKVRRKIDFDKKESARFNKKKRYSSFKIKEIGKKEEDSKSLITVDTSVDWTYHNGKSDGVIASKEFGMIAGCDTEDAVEEGAAKIYNLITEADTEEASTVGDVGDLALMGVTSEWRNSSKNLFRLTNSSMSVRTKVGLGFNNCIRENELGWDDFAFCVFTTNSEDVESRPLFNRFAKADSMKGVPPPLSGDYTSLSDHIDLDESKMSYGTKSSISSDSKSVFNDFVSCNDSDKSSDVITNDFAFSDSNVKSSEPKPYDSTSCALTSSVSTSENEAEIKSNVGTPIQEPIIVQDLPIFFCNSSDKNENTSRTFCNKNGYFNKKAGHFRKNALSVSKLCFVCSSGTHLIKDCDFYETQMVNKTVDIGVRPVHSKNKVNHQNQFVPQAVLFRIGKVNIPPARPHLVPTGKPKVFALVPTSRQSRPFPVPTDRGDSPSVISSWWKRIDGQLLLSPQHVVLGNHIEKENPFPDAEDEGVFDSGCSRSMTDTECLVLSQEFKLPDESMVVLRVPRKHNLYTINLNNLCPRGTLCCLVAYASVDESMKWNRRMGHVNYKNMNRLVKGNLVRGLPPKLFKNDHTCVACCKGEQHKASYKAVNVVSSISVPLQLLHMDLFGRTSIRSIDHKYYCLVITNDYSRFCWVFFLEHKDETYPILKDFINLIENQLNKKVKAIRCDNGTEFKNALLIELCGSKGIKREYSNARTPQQTGVAERKNRTLIEAARTMLANSKLPNIFWTEAKRASAQTVPPGNIPVPTGSIPVPSSDTMVSPDDVPVHTSSPTASFFDDEPTTRLPSPSDLRNHDPSPGIFSSSSYDDAFGAALNNVASTVEVSPVATKRINTIHPQSLIVGDPTSAVIAQALEDPSWVDSMHEEIQQFKFQNVWVLVDLPEAFASYMGFMVYQMDVKSVFLYGRIDKEVYVTQPNLWILNVPRRRGTIDKTLFLKKNKKDIILVQVYVDDIIFGSTKKAWCDEFEALMKGEFQMSAMWELTFLLGSVRMTTIPYEAPKPKSKNESDSPVNSMLVQGIKESPLVLEAYSDSDYVGANKDMKSTTGGCQFLGRSLMVQEGGLVVFRCSAWTRDEHNKVGYLLKPTGSDDYHQIIDFLRASHIRTKSGSWDQFGSPLVVALICLYDRRRFNWSSYIFKGMVSNIGNAKKVLMLNFEGPPMPLLLVMLAHNQEGDGVGVAAQAVPQHMPAPDQPQDHLSTPPRQQTFDPHALVFEHGQSSNPTIAADPFTNKVNSLETELKDHKKLFKDVVGKLFKKVKALEVKLRTKKRKIVVSDSDQEKGGKQDVDLDALRALANAAVTVDSNIPPGGASNNPTARTSILVVVPTGASPVPNGSPSVPLDVLPSVAPAGVLNKGKSLMVEEDINVKERTFKQMQEDILGEHAAKRLHDEEQAQLDRQRAELQRRRQQEVLDSTMYYTKADWINIMAQVEANASLSKTLLGDDVSEDNFPARMAALIKRKKQDLAEKLAKDMRNRPMTQAQQRTYMRQFDKNQSCVVYSTGWSMAYVKSFTDDQLKKEIKKSRKAQLNIQIQAFSRTLKRTCPMLEEPSSKRQKYTKAPIPFIPEVPQSPVVSSPTSFSTRRKINIFGRFEVGGCILSNVHVLETVYGEVVYMFADVSYPLLVKLMELMLKHKLEIAKDVVGNDMTTAKQLIQFIENQLTAAQFAQNYRVFNSPMLHLLRVEMVINSPWIMPILRTKELASPEQTTLDAAFSRDIPLICADFSSILVETQSSRYVAPTGRVVVPTGRRSKKPFILEESLVDTMADQRTMAELLRAPTEGYAEAIVALPILAEQFELKHSLINTMTLNQGGCRGPKEDPVDYPANGGDNDGNESSNDDDDDDDVEKDGEDNEEEEHLAPIDPSIVPIDDPVPLS
nr:putative ribonuclease H-like domain-containing protein [Tanacetum cinerariifolium]